MNSIPVLVEAKKEYTNQLQQILSPRIYEGFKSIYNDILKAMSDDMIQGNQQISSVTKTFQKSLKDIPLWNNEMIKNEHNRIEKISNCDYFENLIEAVFITNTKILTSVQINSNDSMNIKINVPQPQHFIHKCYIECSKEIYKNPYIFDMSKNLTPKEKHSNLRESLSLINHSISNAIRDLLPIRDILKQGLLNEQTEQQLNNINLKDQDEISFQEKNTSENNDDDIDEEDNDEEFNEQNNDEEFNEQNNDEEFNNIQDNNEEDSDDNENNNDENLDLKQDFDNNNLNDEYSNQLNLQTDENQENKIIQLDNTISDNINLNTESNIENNEPKLFGGVTNQEESSELKQINLTSNPIIKKIENVEKIEKLEEKKDIEDMLKPMQQSNSSNENSNLIHINSNIRKMKHKNFIKKKLLGPKMNNSFYQKKYDENLANYNYTSESYLDDDDNNITKNNLNVNYNSSDEEDNNPVELV